MSASLPQLGHFFGTAAAWPHKWQFKRATFLWKVSATLQLGQLRASPHSLQRREVENPRRFKNKIVCSRFSRRSVMVVRYFVRQIAHGHHGSPGKARTKDLVFESAGVFLLSFFERMP